MNPSNLSKKSLQITFTTGEKFTFLHTLLITKKKKNNRDFRWPLVFFALFILLFEQKHRISCSFCQQTKIVCILIYWPTIIISSTFNGYSKILLFFSSFCACMDWTISVIFVVFFTGGTLEFEVLLVYFTVC